MKILIRRLGDNRLTNCSMENKRSFQRTPSAVSLGKKKKKWLKPLLICLAIALVVGLIFGWRTGKFLGQVSTDANIFGSLTHIIPGVNNEIKGEKEGRVNVLLLAMRGSRDPNGGNLADSSMIVSLDTQNNKISYISIPRDLLVKDIQNDGYSKINAIYPQGLAKGGVKQAIADVEKKYGEVAGVPIGYTVVLNYDAFTAVVDAVGGVPINLAKPFEENAQFNQKGVCDSSYFTIPTGEFENKTKKVKDPITGAVKRLRVVKSYPLCKPAPEALECGGNFKLPAGQQTLDSKIALCFARARDNSSDFARAKRQQMILQALKSKALSIGTLTDFNKLNSMLNGLGSNIATDLQGWEMKKLYDVYMAIEKTNPKVIQRVLDNDPVEGLVYGKSDPNYGAVLLPVGDNYDKIHEVVQNTFTNPEQKDISVIQ